MLVSNAIDRAKGKQTHIPNCEREQRHRLPRLRVHPSVRVLALSSLRCNRASAVRCSLNAVHSRRPRPGLRRSRTRDASASFEHPASAAAGASRGLLHIQSNAEDGPCQGPCQEHSRSRSQPPRHSVSYDVVLPPPRLAALAFSHIPRVLLVLVAARIPLAPTVAVGRATTYIFPCIVIDTPIDLVTQCVHESTRPLPV